MREKIKEAILTTLVISNPKSFDKYTWPKIEKIIKEPEDKRSVASKAK